MNRRRRRGRIGRRREEEEQQQQHHQQNDLLILFLCLFLFVSLSLFRANRESEKFFKLVRMQRGYGIHMFGEGSIYYPKADVRGEERKREREREGECVREREREREREKRNREGCFSYNFQTCLSYH